MVRPIVLGRGRSLFEDRAHRISLTLLRVSRFASGSLVLSYRPSSLAKRGERGERGEPGARGRGR